MRKSVAIFASGSGTNAENIIRFFQQDDKSVDFAVFTNNPHAGVIPRVRQMGIRCEVFSREEFQEAGFVEKLTGVDLVVLAGFLWLIPSHLVKAFPGKIINIHPALLPKFGGKGMYGSRVHAAVLESGDKYSGITVHYVNEHYDEGEIILQARCPIYSNDTSSSLAKRIHTLEYTYYPVVVQSCLNQ